MTITPKTGRKIDGHLENPFDHFIILLCETLNPIARDMNMTPNIITTGSLLLGLTSVYTVYKRQYYLGAFLYLIAYIMDCWDGNFARAYHMETVFGDWYDHISDMIKWILMTAMIYLRLHKQQRFYFVAFLIPLIILMGTHLGCQEKIYASHDPYHNFLSFTKFSCPNPKMIHATKYFGVGTFIIFLCVYLILLNWLDKTI